MGARPHGLWRGLILDIESTTYTGLGRVAAPSWRLGTQTRETFVRFTGNSWPPVPGPRSARSLDSRFGLNLSPGPREDPGVSVLRSGYTTGIAKSCSQSNFVPSLIAHDTYICYVTNFEINSTFLRLGSERSARDQDGRAAFYSPLSVWRDSCPKIKLLRKNTQVQEAQKDTRWPKWKKKTQVVANTKMLRRLPLGYRIAGIKQVSTSVKFGTCRGPRGICFACPTSASCYWQRHSWSERWMMGVIT